MSTDDDFKAIVDLLIEGDTEEAQHHLLMENAEEQILRSMGGERMPMDYLLKFEEYLSDHDLYLFDGWEDARLLSKPAIDKFWTTFYLFCKEGTDLRGALRIKNDQEGQNEVKVKKVNGGHILMFKILKRYLDAIEQRNQEKAERVSDEEMRHISR